LPARYAILEPSADLRERQRERLQRQLPPTLFDCIQWLDAPPEEKGNGVLFATEVIDALPTPRFVIRNGEVYEEGVTLDGEGRFMRCELPADMLLNAAVRHVENYLERPFADGYRSELLPQLPYWIQAVMGGLQSGVMLFVDYGYPRSEYYLPERDDGTLRAFYRHRLHNDVYAWPGLQDITASVDFTALAEAGTGAGFDLAGYCTQASFLLGNGLADRLREVEERSDAALSLKFANEAKRLTLPTEMGERFQAMGFARDVDFEAAFMLGDLCWRL
jgi:SAM-dependent MidA family methyltransferase